MVEKKSLRKKILFWGALIAVMAFCLFPFVMMFSSAFKLSEGQFDYPPKIIPQEITFQHFKDVFNPEVFPYFTFFKNSLMVASITAGLSVLVATFGAYSFTRLKYKGQKLIQRGVLFIYMFAGILLVIPLFQIVVNAGLYDTRLSLIITYLVQTLPVSLYMLGNYFRTIPESIEEAAIIDGCSRVEVIFKIIFPLSAPALVSVFIYAFMIAWNEYLFASVFLTSEGNFTLPMGLNSLFHTQHYIWGRMMAASLLTAIPVIVLFLMVEKFISGGLTFGGVKE
ncbi:carbohydrate ABC transporter permease [Halanaerobacter jeridensis]|uniref:Multiple sugar transport system permease protein n=1 Tax=Halanaerobacter jeridensis TaxID=706427 RepID=A0A938XXC5_9FIRM|nr:carbohydrate ABC transporter permease [Halanaerobacter jeridensis]MBM7557025.1 multiple sugar transport system permease protein [Halanaerobacter jeridensis]